VAPTDSDNQDAKPTAGKGKVRLPKFRRRAEARRDEVLDAALELFTEKGFAATRVEDVAQKAGISKGTIYLYFPSKEALMEGLIDRALSPIALQAISVIDAAGVDPRLVFQTIGGLIAGRLSDPKIFAVPKLIVRESVQFPELAQIYRRNVIDKILPRLVRLIEHHVKSGRFRPVDPELAIRSLIGPIIAHLVIAEVFGIVPEGGLQMDRLIAQHIDILMNGLWAKPERKNG
jgi:AcrR family transcriptional regulator